MQCCEKPLSRNRARTQSARDRSFLFCISFSLLVFFFFSLCARARSRERAFSRLASAMITNKNSAGFEDTSWWCETKTKWAEKECERARAGAVFFFFFFFYFVSLSHLGSGKKKERARFLLEAGFFLSLCVCAAMMMFKFPYFEVSESRADGNAMPWLRRNHLYTSEPNERTLFPQPTRKEIQEKKYAKRRELSLSLSEKKKRGFGFFFFFFFFFFLRDEYPFVPCSRKDFRRWWLKILMPILIVSQNDNNHLLRRSWVGNRSNANEDVFRVKSFSSLSLSLFLDARSLA